MSDYTQRLWRYPALAVSTNVILLLWLTVFRSIAVEMTMELYEVMFWATPAIGILVLALVGWLKVSGASHPRVGRCVRWSLVAVTEPLWLFVLQVVLSGFAR